MTSFFIVFWSVATFTSIAWYAVLLFYIGAKGGREIIRMRDDLSRKQKVTSQSNRPGAE